MYDQSSASMKVMHDVANTWLLMNIVHNDYHDLEEFMKFSPD